MKYLDLVSFEVTGQFDIRWDCVTTFMYLGKMLQEFLRIVIQKEHCNEEAEDSEGGDILALVPIFAGTQTFEFDILI